MNRKIIIIKNNQSGKEVWRYDGYVIAESGLGIIVKARFNRSDLLFNGILLKEGDRFLELYLFEKWFNIYQIYDRDDKALKAWYCNITRPIRLDDGFLFYDDLALDLLVYPDGRLLSLDEDEFMGLDLSEEDARKARAALRELRQIFRTNHPLDISSFI